MITPWADWEKSDKTICLDCGKLVENPEQLEVKRVCKQCYQKRPGGDDFPCIPVYCVHCGKEMRHNVVFCEHDDCYDITSPFYERLMSDGGIFFRMGAK